jgi:hypothetical protein
MPLFSNSTFFSQISSQAFNDVHNPGAPTPYSGIYRCPGCGREVTSIYGHALPPQNHHQHQQYSQGNVRWQLVAADKAA